MPNPLKIFSFIILLVISMISLPAFGQVNENLDSLAIEQRKDSLMRIINTQKARIMKAMEQDSLKKLVMSDTISRPWYKPDAIRFGVDLTWGINGVFSKDGVFGETQTYYANNQAFEVTTDMSFKDNRYFVVADIGYATSRFLKPNFNLALRKVDNGFQYDIQGSYFRIGLDYNFMRRYFNNEVMFVGFRYGQSFFSHSFAYNPLPDSVWNVNFDPTQRTPIMEMEQSGLTANWGEITSGLKVNLWKNIFLGYTVRIMFLGSVSGGKEVLKRSFVPTSYIQHTSTATLTANNIPGFGNTEETVKLGFSFYAYYRIPFRKRPEIVLE
jgi:hypothetical protein